MPVASRCPQCDRLVQVPEALFGQLVQCPSCGATFTAGPGPAPRAEEPPVVRAAPPASRGPGPYIDLGPQVFDSEPRRTAPPDEPRRFPHAKEPPYREPPPGERDPDETTAAARAAVALPALGLQIVGGLSLAVALLSLVIHVVAPEQAKKNDDDMRALFNQSADTDPRGPQLRGIIGAVINILAASIVLNGAARMKRLESYRSSVTASVVAMLPCVACCILGLPVGIWALVVLNQQEVKGAFFG